VSAAVGRRGAALRRGGRTPPAAWAAIGLVVAAALTVGGVVYLAWRAQQVVGHLQAAADRVPTLAGQLTTLDVAGAGATTTALRAETAAAVVITRDPVWRLAERFPWGGQNFAAASAGARAADRMATGGAGGALDAAGAVVALRDRVLALDLDPAAARADAARARDGAAAVGAAAGAARGELRGLDRRYLLPPVAAALRRVESTTATVDGLRDDLADPMAVVRGQLGGS
jgi:hypothetical protein